MWIQIYIIYFSLEKEIINVNKSLKIIKICNKTTRKWGYKTEQKLNKLLGIQEI